MNESDLAEKVECLELENHHLRAMLDQCHSLMRQLCLKNEIQEKVISYLTEGMNDEEPK